MITLNASGFALTGTAKAAFVSHSPHYAVNVDVQFSGSGNYTTVSSYVVSTRGSTQEMLGITNAPGANRCFVELDNGSGNFTPRNFSSPYNGADQGDGLGGNLRRGRRAKVTLAVDRDWPNDDWESVYLFRGYTESWEPNESYGKRVSRLTLYDELVNVRAAACPGVILENYSLSSACTYILASGVGLDATTFSVATCSATISYYRMDPSMNCLDALNAIVESRLGRLWCDESGIIQISFELDNGQDAVSRFDFTGSHISTIKLNCSSKNDTVKLVSDITVAATPWVTDACAMTIYKDFEHAYDAGAKTLGWTFASGVQFPATGCAEYWGGFNAFALIGSTAGLSYLIECSQGNVRMVSEAGTSIATATWSTEYCSNNAGKIILKNNSDTATAVVSKFEIWGRRLLQSSGFTARWCDTAIPGDTFALSSDLISSLENTKRDAGFIGHRYGVQRLYGRLAIEGYMAPFLQCGDMITASSPTVAGSSVSNIVRGKNFAISPNRISQAFAIDETDSADYIYSSSTANFTTNESATYPETLSNLILLTSTSLGERAVTSGAIGTACIEMYHTDGSSIVNYQFTQFVNGSGWVTQILRNGNTGFPNENYTGYNNRIFLGPSWSAGSGGGQILRVGMVKATACARGIAFCFNGPTYNDATLGYFMMWNGATIQCYTLNGGVAAIGCSVSWNHHAEEVIFDIIVPSSSSQPIHIKADGELIITLDDTDSRSGYWGFYATTGTIDNSTTYFTVIQRSGRLQYVDTDHTIISFLTTPFVNGSGSAMQINGDGYLSFDPNFNHNTESLKCYIGPNITTPGEDILRVSLVKDDSNYLGVMFCMDATSIASSVEGYMLWWTSAENLYLYKWNATSWSSLQDIGVYAHANEEVTYEIIIPESTEDSIIIKADGVQIGETTDNTTRNGHIGFRVNATMSAETVITNITQKGQTTKWDTDATIINNAMVPENLLAYGCYEANKGTGCAYGGSSAYYSEFVSGWDVYGTSCAQAITIHYGSGVQMDQYFLRLQGQSSIVNIFSQNSTNYAVGSIYTFRGYIKKNGANNPTNRIILFFYGASGTTIDYFYYHNASGVFDSGAQTYAVTETTWGSGVRVATFMPPANTASIKLFYSNYLSAADSYLDATQFQIVKGKFDANTMPPYTTGRLSGQFLPRKMLLDENGLGWYDDTKMAGLLPDEGGLVLQDWSSGFQSRIDYQYHMIARYTVASAYGMVAFMGIVPASMPAAYGNFLDPNGSAPAIAAQVVFIDVSRGPNDFFKVVGQDGALMVNSSGLHYKGLTTNLRNSLSRFGFYWPAGIAATEDNWYVMDTGGDLYKIDKQSKSMSLIATALCALGGGLTIDSTETYLYAVDRGTKVVKYNIADELASGNVAMNLINGITYHGTGCGGSFYVTWPAAAAGSRVYNWGWDDGNVLGSILCTTTACKFQHDTIAVCMYGIHYDIGNDALYVADYNNYFIHRLSSFATAPTWEKMWPSSLREPHDLYVEVNASGEPEQLFVCSRQHEIAGTLL